jgi:hypothetical protein
MLVKTQIKKKMKNCLLIVIALLIIPAYVTGQSGSCGTQVSAAQIALENAINIPQVKPTESLQHLNLELSITVHIIKNDEGNTGITTEAIQSAIDRLNLAFQPVKLKFRICNTLYVDNYQFNTINTSNEKNLTIQHYSKNTINLYFASDVLDGTGAAVAGYTIMPAELKDAVFLDKDFIAGNEMIHQFGHLFNLYHTHETIFGKELVTDVNCNKTGDRCCDTPADPGISGLIDNKCDYTGNLKDTKSSFYIPTTNNYMGLGNDVCRCVFTNDQFNRIIYSVLNQKQHLW